MLVGAEHTQMSDLVCMITPAWKQQPAQQRQKDPDARWTKKNAEVHDGCKNHLKADAQRKLIEEHAVTDASVHDSQQLETANPNPQPNPEKQLPEVPCSRSAVVDPVWTKEGRKRKRPAWLHPGRCGRLAGRNYR